MPSLFEYWANAGSLIGVPINSFTSVKRYDMMCLSKIANKKIRLPSVYCSPEPAGMEHGAEVFPAPRGILEWTVILDFAQHYPRIKRDFNACLDAIRPDGAIHAPNGVRYADPDEYTGIVASLIDELFEMRWQVEALIKKYPKGTRENKEAVESLDAVKMRINDSYGIDGNEGFRLHSIRSGTTVTEGGVEGLHIASEVGEEWGYKTLYGHSLEYHRPILIRERYGSSPHYYTMPIGQFVDRGGCNQYETMAWIPEINTVEWKPIVCGIAHPYTGKLLEFVVDLDKGKTVVTPEHSVYTSKNGKVELVNASTLKLGDSLVSANRIYPVITSIREVETKYPCVYDIEVDGLHNFFDADGMLLVHNTDSVLFQSKHRPIDLSAGWYEETKYETEEMAKAITDRVREWERSCGVKKPTMEISPEAIYRRIVIAGKKNRYVADCAYDWKKGDTTHLPIRERLKIRGFEVRKSNTAQYTKHIQNEIFERIMLEPDRVDILRWFHREYNSIVKGEKNYKLFLRPTSVHTDNPTSQHVRAKAYGIQNFGWRYGPKIFLLYIRPPEAHADINVIALPKPFTPLPPGFKVDWEKCAQTCYLSPIGDVCDLLELSASDVVSGKMTEKLFTQSSNMSDLIGGGEDDETCETFSL